MLEIFDDLHEKLLNRNAVSMDVIEDCISKAAALKAPYFGTLFVFLRGVSKFNQAQYTEALELFRSCMEQLEQGDTIYNKLLYWTGKAAYITGDLIAAVNYLKQAVLRFAYASCCCSLLLASCLWLLLAAAAAGSCLCSGCSCCMCSC